MDIKTLHDELLTTVSAKQHEDQMDAYQYLYGQLSGTSATPAAVGKKIHQNIARAKAKMERHATMFGTKWNRLAERKIKMESATMRVLRDRWPADYAWAKAFQEVLGVGDSFYADADAARKRYLQAHYEELATHDTPKGRKAAKVIAARIKRILAQDDHEDLLRFAEAPFQFHGMDASRMRSFIPSFQSVPKLNGKRATTIIVDDLEE